MYAFGALRLPAGLPRGVLLLWAAALAAACLSVAVALGAFPTGDSPGPSNLSASAEVAARNQRIAFFEQRAAADPLDFLSLNLLAGEYLQRARETGDVSDYQRAEVAAMRSLELSPHDNYSAFVNLAAVRLAQHGYRAVEPLAREAMAVEPSKAAPWGLLADAQVAIGRYDEAEESLARMMELQPGAAALSRLANLAFLRGDEFNALDFWRQAIDSSGGLPLENQAWAHVQLGLTRFAFGELAQAAAEHEKALDLFPGYAPALAGLGQVRAAQQRWDEAIDLYARAVSRLPRPAYVAALGDVYAVTGRPREAEQQYALVEAIASLYEANGVNTDLEIAGFLADHDREAEAALAMARGAYEAAPGVYAADELAWALYRTGDYTEAASYSAEARAHGTPEPAFYYHAALISRALGELTQAREHLRRVAELNPRFAPLQAERISALLDELEVSR